MNLKHIIYTQESSVITVGLKFYETTIYKLFVKKTNQEIIEFREFQDDLKVAYNRNGGKSLAPNTRLTYCEAVIKFIDYLYAAGIKNHSEPVELSYVHKVVMSYPSYLVEDIDETNVLIWTISNDMKGFKPRLSTNSANIHLAAIEKYLFFSEKRASALHTKTCRDIGISPSDDNYMPIFESVWGSNKISFQQKLNWQNSTLLGGIIGAYNYSGISSKIFKKFKTKDSEIRHKYNLSEDQIKKILNTPKITFRERLLYAFLHASGMRISEALMLQFSHINFDTRKIYMAKNIDLKGLTIEEKELCKFWKGRHTKNDEVFLFGYEDIFWESLDQYIRSDEFTSDLTHDFIFVFKQGIRKGRPLLLVNKAKINCRSLSNLEKKYKLYQKQIGIQSTYGFHIARHSLINYLMYEIPLLVSTVNGKEEITFGINEIQIVRALIGHESISSTSKYIKDNEELVKTQHYSARKILNCNVSDEKAKLIALEAKHQMEARKLTNMINKL